MAKFKTGGFARRINTRHYDTWIGACKTAGIKPSDILEVVDFDEDDDASGDGGLKFKFIRGQWSSDNFEIVKDDSTFKVGGFLKRKSDKYNETWIDACKRAGIQTSDYVEIEDIDEYGNYKLKGIKGTGWNLKNFELVDKDDTIFEAGDIVTIVKGSRYDGKNDNINPKHGVRGVVGRLEKGYIHVMWPSGKENCYNLGDLEHVKVKNPVTHIKVGDWVQRNEDAHNPIWFETCKDLGLEVDSYFKVVKDIDSNGYIRLSGVSGSWVVDTFHLAPKVGETIKVGDSVKRRKNLINNWWKTQCLNNFSQLTDTFIVTEVFPCGKEFLLEGFDPKTQFAIASFEKAEPVDTPSTPIIEKKEEVKMSVATRRVVDVMLMDNDKGLDVSMSLVAVYKGIVTEDTDAVTVQEVMMNHNIAAKLKAHNEQRGKQIDKEIRDNHGTEVFLQPVKLKDLTWVVK
ncbi:MAG: hypothetical protein ACRC6R_06000 [Bacteroidales bacterium]